MDSEIVMEAVEAVEVVPQPQHLMHKVHCLVQLLENVICVLV